jgi:transposase InsO family protein
MTTVTELLREISAASCIEAFMSHWVTRFGMPRTITSDRGAHFSSAAWSSFCSKLGMQHCMTMAYHPQANGIVERAHRQLKASLRARGANTDWPSHLPGSSLAYMQPPRRSAGSRQQRPFMASRWYCLGNLTQDMRPLPGCSWMLWPRRILPHKPASFLC